MSTDRARSAAEAEPAQPNTDVLRAEGLKVSYGKVQALRGLDMYVNQGEVVSLIGPNGAGKSTFANTATGFIGYEGSVTYRGQEVSQVGQRELVERGMIHCTEKRDLFGYMSVDENLRLGAYAIEDESYVEKQLEFVYDLFPRLEERENQNARSMSGGEQQMLAIGRALMGDPDLLILDDISQAFGPIQDQGVTILLTEQNVTFALKHADRIYLLENGEVVKTGTPEELRGDDYIRESYLGG